jgi:hypothetical protein
MRQVCNRSVHAKKVNEIRRMKFQVARELRPLFAHILKLSISSAKHGYCQRAGQELRKAKNLAKKYPAVWN